MRFSAGLAGACCALVLTGCVGPAPDDAAYEAKAAQTAQSALSAARTALLSSRTFLDDRLTSAYLDPVLTAAEQTLGSVRTTFDSVQPPPTAASDDLRSTLDPLLESAGSDLTELRIAARRDRTGALGSTADHLSKTADQLEAFAAEHGG
jgi:hypothetical protein